MSQAEWQARFEGATLLVAPLDWDCFRKLDDSDNVDFSLPQASHESEQNPED